MDEKTRLKTKNFNNLKENLFSMLKEIKKNIELKLL